MASRINADSSNGLQLVSDSSGEIQFQSSGITKAQVTSDGLINQDNVVISNRPVVRVDLSADQSIVDVTWTKVQLDTIVTDTDSAYDATTNYRFTVPSNKAGLYQISAMAGYDVGANTNLVRNILQIQKNGSFYYPRADQNFTASYARYGYLSLNIIVDLSEGDYIELFAYCDDTSGNPVLDAANCSISIHKIIG